MGIGWSAKRQAALQILLAVRVTQQQRRFHVKKQQYKPPPAAAAAADIGQIGSELVLVLHTRMLLVLL
jgi:hypothetical protein